MNPCTESTRNRFENLYVRSESPKPPQMKGTQRRQDLLRDQDDDVLEHSWSKTVGNFL